MNIATERLPISPHLKAKSRRVTCMYDNLQQICSKIALPPCYVDLPRSTDNFDASLSVCVSE